MAESRKVAALCGAAGIALLALSGTALAEDKFTWSATATGTSDYVFRGISQTDNDPTIQGSLNVGYGMFYAGVWASGLDFDNAPGVEIEVDYYAGIMPKWGPATFDFGVIYYDYPDDDTLDYYELKAGVGGEIFTGLTAKGTFYWSPDILGEEWYVYEGTLSYALPAVHMFTPTISGLVGYTDFEESSQFDYTYWNAGIALTVEKLTFDFRYWDTDADASSCFGAIASTCDERFVFSATLALP